MRGLVTKLFKEPNKATKYPLRLSTLLGYFLFAYSDGSAYTISIKVEY